MKNYDQFLNEGSVLGEFNSDLPIGFQFVIDFRDSTDYQKSDFINEVKKYFNLKNKNLLYDLFSDDFVFGRRITTKTLEITLTSSGVELECETYASSSSSGIAGRESDQTNIITLQEFLMVGFKGVKNFVKMKNTANKYNI